VPAFSVMKSKKIPSTFIYNLKLPSFRHGFGWNPEMRRTGFRPKGMPE
jgi:hypothetical protein